MTKNPNENVLAGVRCPKCGHTSPFNIVATCWAEVWDDGVAETCEFEWTEDSACECGNCRFHGRLCEFLEGDDA